MRQMGEVVRILHSIGPGQMAGTQRALVTYLEAADHDRFRHQVRCSTDGELTAILRRMNIPVTVASSGAPWHPAAAGGLARALRRGRFHVFHANPTVPRPWSREPWG